MTFWQNSSLLYQLALGLESERGLYKDKLHYHVEVIPLVCNGPLKCLQTHKPLSFKKVLALCLSICIILWVMKIFVFFQTTKN